MLFKCCNNSQFNGQILTFKKFKDGEQLNMESERWGGSGGFGNDGWEGGGGEKKKKTKRRRKKGKGKGTEEEVRGKGRNTAVAARTPLFVLTRFRFASLH